MGTIRKRVDTKVFLNGEWWKLFAGLGVKNQYLIAEKFSELYADYSGPHRYYHTPPHIEHCLDEFKPVWRLCKNPMAVKLALFGHDKFYNVTRKDNELRSAVWARDMVLEMNFGPHFAWYVYELILATCHKVMPDDCDSQIVVDIDLSSLGASWEVFRKNTDDIAREYCEVLNISRKAFNSGRAKFIDTMLPPNRPYIYCTDFFRQKYEARVQENLKRSLKELQAVRT